MYTVDARDKVTPRNDLPQSSIGAPCPMVLAGEGLLHLAYYLEQRDDDWDGTTVRIVTEDSTDEPCALVRFRRPRAHLFGPPNDEAFKGHPLAARGLQPYAVFEVTDSSWIRLLERMNSVHPYHRPERYRALKHFVFAFHDSVFECVAEDFEMEAKIGSVADVLRGSWQAGH